MGSFFSQAYSWSFSGPGRAVNFWEFSRETSTVMGIVEAHSQPTQPHLRGDFGEDVHAADLGGHAELCSLFFYADDRRLAADPALFARGELGRKDQHQLDFGALLHAGLGVEEHAVGANIASLRGVVGALRSADARGHAGRDSCSCAAIIVGCHTVKSAHPLYTNAGNSTRGSGNLQPLRTRRSTKENGETALRTGIVSIPELRVSGTKCWGAWREAPERPGPAPWSAHWCRGAWLPLRAACRSAWSGSRPAPAIPW